MTARALLALVMSFAVVWLIWSTFHQSQPKPQRPPACATEDQAQGPCFWDAQRQGNGRGRSFYVDEQGRVYYTTH